MLHRADAVLLNVAVELSGQYCEYVSPITRAIQRWGYLGVWAYGWVEQALGFYDVWGGSHSRCYFLWLQGQI